MFKVAKWWLFVNKSSQTCCWTQLLHVHVEALDRIVLFQYKMIFLNLFIFREGAIDRLVGIYKRVLPRCGVWIVTVQLRYIRTTHTRIIRSYFAYTRMSIRVYAYVHTRIRVCQYARICPFVMHSHKFLCRSIVGQTKDIWEWKGFQVQFAYC